MCLYTSTKKPSIAQEDITCYKLLSISENGKNLLSPFTRKCVCDKRKIIGHIQKPKQIFCFPKVWLEQWEIGKGAIHAYKYVYKALKEANVYYCTPTYKQREEHKIFKCIIPKGTKYWVGEADDICSRKLKYLEELTFSDAEAYEILHEAFPNWAPLKIREHKSGKKKRKRKAKLR